MLMLSVLPILSMAQGFPSRMLRIIVPLSAGGNQDIVARAIAQKLSEQLGQQIVVENRPSASGISGTNFVSKAQPDGYTYLSISTTFVLTPSVLRNLSYDPVKDFSGVSLVARIPLLLVSNPHFSLVTTKEIIAFAKRHPNELTYGSSGTGSNSHFAAALFSHKAGINMTHIPYKGNAPALIDVIGGQIALLFDPISTSMSYVKAGKLKAFGVTSPKRSLVFPKLPTIAESDLSGYEQVVFNGIVAPFGTPHDILIKMHSEISKVIREVDLRVRFLEQGVELEVSDSVEEFNRFIKIETEKYAILAHQSGIVPE